MLPWRGWFDTYQVVHRIFNQMFREVNLRGLMCMGLPSGRLPGWSPRGTGEENILQHSQWALPEKPALCQTINADLSFKQVDLRPLVWPVCVRASNLSHCLLLHEGTRGWKVIEMLSWQHTFWVLIGQALHLSCILVIIEPCAVWLRIPCLG